MEKLPENNTDITKKNQPEISPLKISKPKDGIS